MFRESLKTVGDTAAFGAGRGHGGVVVEKSARIAARNAFPENPKTLGAR